jgi:hypothetical protein
MVSQDVLLKGLRGRVCSNACFELRNALIEIEDLPRSYARVGKVRNNRETRNNTLYSGSGLSYVQSAKLTLDALDAVQIGRDTVKLMVTKSMPGYMNYYCSLHARLDLLIPSQTPRSMTLACQQA